MTQRITRKLLDTRLNLVNRMLNLPETQYTRIDGRLRANIGNLHIEDSCGTVKIYRMDNDAGGCEMVSGCGSKRELDWFIDGMLAGLRLARERETK